MAFPPPNQHVLHVFNDLPDANEDTFYSGVRLTDLSGETRSLVLYRPNLQIIGSIDNSSSDFVTQYEVSVTQGFSFSATQGLEISQEIGGSFVFGSASISTTFSLSFTEQWHEETTKTISFTCPARKMGYLYQGTLFCQVLFLDTEGIGYKWSNEPGKALTQVVVTSEAPLGTMPSNDVTITNQ